MTRSPVQAFVALGANVGDPVQALQSAIALLDQISETTLERSSSLYRSAPWQADGPDYVNAVVALRTTLCAPDLLQELQRIEAEFGRERAYPNSPRTLDLDLLFYGNASMESENLTVPHPRLRQRAFVLVPLAEIAADRVTSVQLLAVADQQISRLP